MGSIKLNDNLRNLLDNDFVIPSSNPSELENNLVSRFLYSTNGSGSKEYYKDVVSLALAKLGEKSGVSFDMFKSHSDRVVLGKFWHEANKISLEESFLGKRPIAYATTVLSHETYHKHQHEVNKQAKLFSRWQDRYTIGHSLMLQKVLGLNYNNMFYRINKHEKDAYTYNSLFMNSFLNKAEELAKFMRDPERQQYVQSQQLLVQEIDRVNQQSIETSENMFIANHLQEFYEKSARTFSRLVSYYLDSQSNSHEELRNNYSDIMTMLSSLSDSKNASSSMAVIAMAEILGACPQKENVETFIDLLTTSKIDSSYEALSKIISSRVPITQNDFMRLAISSRNSEDGLPNLFDPKTLDKVDEEVWAKSLVATMGTKQARETIEKFKTAGEMPNTDFGVVEKVLYNYSEKPLLSIDGKDFYNCRDILQFVSANESAKFSKFGDNIVYYQTCGTLSKTLANIVNHFNNPTANNPDFVAALDTFVNNPRMMQFKDNEIRNEVSAVFTSNVSDKIAEYIDAVRTQGTHHSPQDTEYVPLTETGMEYDEALEDSLAKLANSLKELATTVNTLSRSIQDEGLSFIMQRFGAERQLLDVDVVADNYISNLTSRGSLIEEHKEGISAETVSTYIKSSNIDYSQSDNNNSQGIETEQTDSYRGIPSLFSLSQQEDFLGSSIGMGLARERLELLYSSGKLDYQTDFEEDESSEPLVNEDEAIRMSQENNLGNNQLCTTIEANPPIDLSPEK